MNTALIFVLICGAAFQEGLAKYIIQYGERWPRRDEHTLFSLGKNMSSTKDGGYDITYPAEGILKLFNITRVWVHDLKENQPTVEFTSGGIGHLSAKFSIRHKNFEGINVWVAIYGNYIGPCDNPLTLPQT